MTLSIDAFPPGSAVSGHLHRTKTTNKLRRVRGVRESLADVLTGRKDTPSQYAFHKGSIGVHNLLIKADFPTVTIARALEAK
jgi:hypothetical protein